ncbi:hypothetical protein KSC_081100 [Ktedonobacter sp. SOSP1-52]|uniref:hypothetical protein n=1 Tax=Ktedonobacter sp. SOSP1-52 TaxID=2778366 RepID=UPI0019150095|nr:hypothetical protein [Ktedonobacter sp. SOSP1-52]GHO69218.1 hypothetical protein KSC_081100 [Ktedonobacter sp. SOSP1-52]
MGSSIQLPAYGHRLQVRLQKGDLYRLFTSLEDAKHEEAILRQLGPLREAFASFLGHERELDPPDNATLARYFDACSDPEQGPQELLEILRLLAPGNGHIGRNQVNFLADHLRTRVEHFLQSKQQDLSLLHTHDHVFGSGGDFCKTIHASTAAAIVAAPLVKICKTGTTNVTSYHGSAQAMETFGYRHPHLSIPTLNQELDSNGFTFIPLSALNFPYSQALKQAREALWHEAMKQLTQHCDVGDPNWQEMLRTTPLTLDIFKIVSPNAQVLRPAHHSTGVCSLAMIPYVLSLYLHLRSEGIIVHCYDGIDELSNASSVSDPQQPINLLIQVTRDEVIFEECSPEDIGLTRAQLADIREEVDLAATQSDIWHILSGEEQGPRRDFIVANAALLLVANQGIIPPQDSLHIQLREAIARINAVIDSHQVADNFTQLLNAHQQQYTQQQ